MEVTTKRKNHVLVLRGCHVDENGQLYSDGNGHRFAWPRSGYVEAADWNPAPKCGGGLHGFLWGEGDASLWSGEIGIVVTVDPADIVDLGDKVKFSCGNVVYAGDRKEAAQYIKEHNHGAAVMYCYTTAGDYGVVIVGDMGFAKVGRRGIAAAGDDGVAVAGDYGSATVGAGGEATVGRRGTALAGLHSSATTRNGGNATISHRGTASAGDFGTAIAGDFCAASAGDFGTAIAGDFGTAIAGDEGAATAGLGGAASAGRGGCVRICGPNGWRHAMVDGVQILPGVEYWLDDSGEFVRTANDD